MITGKRILNAASLFVFLSLAASMQLSCDGGDDEAEVDGSPEGTDGTDTDTSQPPSAPDGEGAVDKVESFREWYLIGNDLTPGHGRLELVIAGPETDTEHVDVWIDGTYAGRFDSAGGKVTVDPEITALDPAEHEILLSADGAEQAFAKLSFWMSYPIYVLMTNDWDGSDHSDGQLTLQENLHQAHPEMKMTHFVGPYTYTDPEVSEERAQFLTDWLLDMRDVYSDEIGLHIHPYCNFVETADLTCLDTPSFSSTSDATGYSVCLSAYTQEETEAMLAKAKELFVEHGLGTPTSFRAGGWAAQIHTLTALEAEGFVADTSANNWARIEEWENVADATIYQWSQENWSAIGDTSQPYYPAADDIQSTGTPRVEVLEVPDNGSLVDYVSDAEMIEIFEANWPGDALLEPKAYVIGYHPVNFNSMYYDRLDKALNHIDKFLSVNGDGPVVYETLSNTVKVWK